MAKNNIDVEINTDLLNDLKELQASYQTQCKVNVSLALENKKLRELVCNYVDPFTVRTEDEAFVEYIQKLNE